MVQRKPSTISGRLERRRILEAVGAGAVASSLASETSVASEPNRGSKKNSVHFAQFGAYFTGKLNGYPRSFVDRFIDYSVTQDRLVFSSVLSNEKANALKNKSEIVHGPRNKIRSPPGNFGPVDIPALPLNLGHGLNPSQFLRIQGDHRFQSIRTRITSEGNLEIGSEASSDSISVREGTEVDEPIYSTDVVVREEGQGTKEVHDPRTGEHTVIRKLGEEREIEVTARLQARNYGTLPVYGPDT